MKVKITQKQIRKAMIALISLLVILTLLIVYIKIFYRSKPPMKYNFYSTEFKYKKEGYTAEVKIENPSYYRVLYENGKRKGIISKVKRTPLNVIELPPVGESLDITKDRKPEDALTWPATTTDSAKYLNYLKDQGFTIVREIYTTQYIDILLQDTKVKEDTSNQQDIKKAQKRLIILPNKIMIGDIREYQDIELIWQVEAESYISKYKTQEIEEAGDK